MTQPVPDIATLYARDPETFTDAEFDALLEDLRAKRHLFNQAPAGTRAPKLTAKEEKVKKDLSGLTLDLKL